MSFIRDIAPGILLFFLGDLATTYYGLMSGFTEQNPIANGAYYAYGFEVLIAAKILFFSLLYLLYKLANKRYWNATARTVSCVGLYITIKNALLVF
ncbi:DUF5658 family protein [Methanolobus sp. ZRKC3]|uniref:DUF5658 family protein n=1 Tax=Methanolobus sp. ZRKC3 TaxID=3125786 RepID=UPI00324AB08C